MKLWFIYAILAVFYFIVSLQNCSNLPLCFNSNIPKTIYLISEGLYKFDSTFLQKFVMCKITIIYVLKDTGTFHISAKTIRQKFKGIFYLVLFVIFYHTKFRRSVTICPRAINVLKFKSLTMIFFKNRLWMLTITIQHTSSHNDLPQNTIWACNDK